MKRFASWLLISSLVFFASPSAHGLTASSRLHRQPKAAAAPHESHKSAKAADAAQAKAGRRAKSAGKGSARLLPVSRGRRGRRGRSFERFTASSFASSDQFAGDVTLGEDPIVRQAAIDALGDMNGTAVVIDPSNGRVLAMVNQKLALSSGAEPCSTIKLTVAMAALSEGLVTRDTEVDLGGWRMNMTDALAHSNNVYFEHLGREMGFEKVHHYATLFGLGEKAGYQIEGEQLGTYPEEEISAARGGVGRMCSFGEGIKLTPLQLGAFVAALANGGKLFYLQHPTTPDEVAHFEPRLKRQLDTASHLPEMIDGMAGAVEYGTARHLRQSFTELPVFGKTGTCSDHGTRFGWFASFSQAPQGSLVTVFFLEGGRPTFGPRAAELTGSFYRNLWDHNYFAEKGSETTAFSHVEGAATAQ